MTPEEARELLAHAEGTDAAALQGHMDWKDVAQALDTIAGLRCVYAVEAQLGEDDHWMQVTRWTPDPGPDLLEGRPLRSHERLIRCLVSDVEVVE